MNLRRILAAPVAAALLACSSGMAGCAGIRESPVDTALAASVTDPDALYSSVLRDHVRDGLVDYPALGHDPRFARYISWLAATAPDALPDDRARLAFWINAYNAYTLKLIADNYPVKSINELHAGGRIIGYLTRRTAWDRKIARVGGVRYSLNTIEHRIIRPRFKDERAHFALVCAALSCAPLRSEAYTAGRLDEQLDEQGRLFFAQEEKNRFDVASKTAYLSKILDWYRDDFGRSDADMLRAIARFLPGEARASIERDARAWRVRHTRYDWALNEQSAAPR